MSSRQSEPPANDVRSHDYTERQRAHFTSAIRRRAEEMGIDEKERTTWLRTKLEALGEDVRWQTVQRWYQGQSYPGMRRVRLIGRALGMRDSELILPLDDHEDDPEHWRVWAKTADGLTMTQEERHLLRFFPWPQTPTVGDYRSLLAAVRTNAERPTTCADDCSQASTPTWTGRRTFLLRITTLRRSVWAWTTREERLVSLVLSQATVTP